MARSTDGKSALEPPFGLACNGLIIAPFFECIINGPICLDFL